MPYAVHHAAKSPSQRSARKRRERRGRLLAAQDDAACINCRRRFRADECRNYYGGAHEVGPFCDWCQSLIKLHEHGAAR